MPWPTKSNVQAKKVPPPAIPLDHTFNRKLSIGCHQPDEIQSLTVMDERNPPTVREGSTPLRMKDHKTEYGFTKNVHTMNTYANPVFGATIAGREPLTHKAAVFYHQQLALQEDQGIDLAQSPGRDSPGSSSGSAGSGSRHSTASLDSGRASSYVTGGGTSIRGGQFSSPRCSSVSSCSIGSVDRISQRCDNDIILDWLVEIRFEDYAQLFVAAGYDLPTIARMTPEDLTAIGITNPQHRERIKKQIDKLQVVDNLPDFIPGSIEEWLRLLRLDEYIQSLLDQNYKTVRDVTQVTWEDLEDIGIVKLGHQKKILLAIKRVKDIMSGKRSLSLGGNQQIIKRPVVVQPSLRSMPKYLSDRNSWDDNSSVADDYFNEEATLMNHENRNSIVVIKIRQPRVKSLESLEDISDRNTRTHLTFSHYSTSGYSYYPQMPMANKMCPNSTLGYPTGTVLWRRSYDDGDITPTNDTGHYLNDQGGGTLPRQRNMSAARNQSMIERNFSNDPSSEFSQHLISNQDFNIHTDPNLIQNNMPHGVCSGLGNKKIAPEPPLRNCSIRTGRSLIAKGPHNVQQPNYFQMQNRNLPLHSHSIHPQQQQQRLDQPIYANFSTIHQTKAEVHCEFSGDNNKAFQSDSSIDSIDTIPFANENTGTIKQKLGNKQDVIVSSLSLSSSSSSSASSTTTVANAAIACDIVGAGQSDQKSENHRRSPAIGGATSPLDSSSSSGGHHVLRNPNDSINVLNDIGNMLANLTDELDAMLEEEKRVGLNDSE